MTVRQIGRECTAFLQPNSQSPRSFTTRACETAKHPSRRLVGTRERLQGGAGSLAGRRRLRLDFDRLLVLVLRVPWLPI